eukprot:TRINITY_DN38201_c0_g1_i2.p1 TRINITY_DN38201_c0_g1~~TRINITY_DN38201_c0_g1_i2.p1  ORF type:complete len:118 (-),score=25.61 TRINITY_DN38201_c0_g1_i2:360-713(-)
MGLCNGGEDKPVDEDRDEDMRRKQSQHMKDTMVQRSPVISVRMFAPMAKSYQIKGMQTVADLVRAIGADLGKDPEWLQLKIAGKVIKWVEPSDAHQPLFFAGFSDGCEFSVTDLSGE